MVWVNGTQNVGLVNFQRPGIAFTIVQISSSKNGREGLKLVTKIALMKWNADLRLELSFRENRLPFQVFRCSHTFSTGSFENELQVSNRISLDVFVNGKQPPFGSVSSENQLLSSNRGYEGIVTFLAVQNGDTGPQDRTRCRSG